jgi:hypothetical protein
VRAEVSNDSPISRKPPRPCLWKENPNRLVTLWDIVRQFPISDVYMMLKNMEGIHETCLQIVGTIDGGRPVPESDVESLRLFIPEWRRLCTELGFENASDSLMLFSIPFDSRRKGMIMDVSECRTTLQHILIVLQHDVESRHSFAHIHPGRRQYAFQDHLFGNKVSKGFPSARYDIREAGNCFAVDCNTASIFHLTRVAEHGLRALARDRRVKIPKGPVELATWEQIIKQLEDAELAIQGYPKTLAREAQFEFYHGAMMEFRSFKNIWRNRYFHTRAGFKEDDERREADRVMQRVGDFMRILATAISEKKRTPMIWKRAYNKS